MKILAKTLLTATTLLSLVACGGGRNNLIYPDLPTGYDPNQGNTYTPAPDTHGYQPNQPSQPSYSILKNVFLRVDPEIGAQIKYMSGRLEPKRKGDPVIFDDPTSFIFHVAQGELEIDNENITRLKNKYTFNYPDAPIKEVNVEFTPGKVRMSGKMKQLIWVPFSMEGTISPTPDGKLMLVPSDIRTAGIPVKSMLDLLGLTTSKLLSVSAERGLHFEGNNAILDPSKLFPPPQMQGRVIAAEVLQGKMKLIFQGPEPVPPPRMAPDPQASGYMHCYGGQFLIMNELQRGAELQMVDMNPANPFDFYLGEYKRHLKAGYVKVANDQGTLITLMPDYAQLGQSDVWDQYPGGKPNLRPYGTYTAANRYFGP